MTDNDAIVRALGEALTRDAAAQPNDADLLGRLIDGALATPAAPPVVKASLGLRIGAAIVGAALLGGGA